VPSSVGNSSTSAAAPTPHVGHDLSPDSQQVSSEVLMRDDSGVAWEQLFAGVTDYNRANPETSHKKRKSPFEGLSSEPASNDSRSMRKRRPPS
jgi:hypothetical protein